MESVHYFIEFRSRLLRCLLCISVFFVGLCFFANRIYDFLTIPLLKQLPEGKALIATSIISPFLAPYKLVFVVAIFIAIPFCLYQLWTFIAPALYQQERRFFWPLLLISSLLFYIGVAFAYFVVLPSLFQFLIHMAPQSVEVKPDINQFLDFVLKMFLVFGFAFEVPVMVLLLIRVGIFSIKTVQRKRPYIIVGAFVVSMFLTPPDVISQIMLALPLWGLFEIGLLTARLVSK